MISKSSPEKNVCSLIEDCKRERVGDLHGRLITNPKEMSERSKNSVVF